MNPQDLSNFLGQAQGMLTKINQFKEQLPPEERLKLDQEMANVDVSEVMKGIENVNKELSELAKKCQ